MAWKNEQRLATARGRALRAATPTALAAHYDRKSGRVVVHLDSKLVISFAPRDAQGLEQAKPAQLEEIEISPSGMGLHFPKVDADIFIPGLLEGFLGSRRWMASRLGQKGGESRTRAKRKASRANGRLGGRPRKAG